MKDKLEIEGKLLDYQAEILPYDEDSNYVRTQVINALSWLFNQGNLRSEHDLQTKIQSTKEEIIGYEFANYINSVEYKSAKAVLKELESCL